MISTNLVALDRLKVKVFLNKSYYVLVSIHNVNNKILSRDSNDIVNMIM